MEKIDKVFLILRRRITEYFQGFGRFFKRVLLLFTQDYVETALFILFCTIITAATTSILKKLLVKAMMLVSGVTYIAPVNLKQVLLNPLSIIMMLLFAVIVTLMSLFEIAGLLHTFSVAQAGRETNLTCMFMAGFRACWKALNPRNWPIMVFILVLVPLTKLLPLSGSTFKLILPGFVNQTIDYTKWLNVLYYVLYWVLILFLAVYIFSINGFVLQKESFFKSCSKSRKLCKGHVIEVLLNMFLLTVILNFAINSVSSIIVVNGEELMSFMRRTGNVVAKSEAVGTYTYALRQVLKSFLSPAINNAALTVLFYKFLDDKTKKETVSSEVHELKEYSMKRTVAFVVSLAVVSLAIIGVMTYRYSYLFESVDRPLVCAHRGDNVNAPENTMPAFELAASENLKWIELDVHQTSDGVIVCNHDSTIKRVTGRNLAIHDVTYEDLSKIELGPWMPGEYEHVHICTLREALELAKENDMNVQVELKGHPADKNFEENVIKVINETGMHDNVMIIAQDASRLMRVMEIDPTITKGYCMVIAVGDLNDIEYTDNITIEETYVTPELVRAMHEKGIKVFCWTVDLDDTVQYLVSCDVDVIGTDNPMLINNALDKADYSGGLSRAAHILMHMIANMDK
ncbi:MAG: glycerophosphoryl diester phosphodiesterase membrane domain-containing protein [Clostridiales bacterium]|nr:glycerophosphoryl diester phosphodiesterase membrane domain-containing protein [Clostridiales bacterium]MBR3701427.1 glycerophosphoryl diester phosphodiesterase membrane domain-containing protein [Clostridiales bacterium]